MYDNNIPIHIVIRVATMYSISSMMSDFFISFILNLCYYTAINVMQKGSAIRPLNANTLTITITMIQFIF